MRPDVRPFRRTVNGDKPNGLQCELHWGIPCLGRGVGVEC